MAKTPSHPFAPRKTPISQAPPVILHDSPVILHDSPVILHASSVVPVEDRHPPSPVGGIKWVYLPYPEKFSRRMERFYRSNSKKDEILSVALRGIPDGIGSEKGIDTPMRSFTDHLREEQSLGLHEGKATDRQASLARVEKVVGDADSIMRTLRDRIKASRSRDMEDAEVSSHTQGLEDALGTVSWEYRSVSELLRGTPKWDAVEAAVARLRKAVLAARVSLKS